MLEREGSKLASLSWPRGVHPAAVPCPCRVPRNGRPDGLTPPLHAKASVASNHLPGALQIYAISLLLHISDKNDEVELM